MIKLKHGIIKEMTKTDNLNSEQILSQIKKQKEEADKLLLTAEIFIGTISVSFFLILTLAASFVQMADWVRLLLIISGVVIVVTGSLFALKLEQAAGYYECAECHYKYVPSYSTVLRAMHIGRTRYMKCPECDKKSWQKKVISK